MKVLIVGNYWHGSLEASCLHAFKKLGCDVHSFDFIGEYNKINPFSSNKYINRLTGILFYSQLNKKLLDCIKTREPELVLVIKGMLIFPDTLKEIRESTNVVLFNFNPDNPFNTNKGASNESVRKSIPLYDCYFIWGKFLMPKLKEKGAKCVEYLPFAYDPDCHYPSSVSDSEKGIYGNDVVFIGTWDKEREKLLEDIAHYDLAIWGNSWGKLKIGSPLKKKWKKKTAIGEEFAKVCNSSKIILNFIRKQNGNAHNMRTFEVPACNGLMLATRTDEQCEFFEEDKEIVCFNTPEELKKKIDFLLSNEALRLQISKAAHAKVKPHVYAERAKKILEVYKQIKEK